jgi:S-adenosylmethionine hydrolase
MFEPAVSLWLDASPTSPRGVVVGVVDPGVGGGRKAIAIEVADGEAVFVGPDNGLLAPAVAMAAARSGRWY